AAAAALAGRDRLHDRRPGAGGLVDRELVAGVRGAVADHEPGVRADPGGADFEGGAAVLGGFRRGGAVHGGGAAVGVAVGEADRVVVRVGDALAGGGGDRGDRFRAGARRADASGAAAGDADGGGGGAG